jgi:hypothetical protein
MANTNPIGANTPYIYSVCLLEEDVNKGITVLPKGINVIPLGKTGVAKGINVMPKGKAGDTLGKTGVAMGKAGMVKVSRFMDEKLNSKVIVVSLNIKNAMRKVIIQMFSENIFCLVKGLTTIVQI